MLLSFVFTLSLGILIHWFLLLQPFPGLSPGLQNYLFSTWLNLSTWIFYSHLNVSISKTAHHPPCSFALWKARPPTPRSRLDIQQVFLTLPSLISSHTVLLILLPNHLQNLWSMPFGRGHIMVKSTAGKFWLCPDCLWQTVQFLSASPNVKCDGAFL